MGLPQLDDVVGEAFCPSRSGTAPSSLFLGEFCSIGFNLGLYWSREEAFDAGWGWQIQAALQVLLYVCRGSILIAPLWLHQKKL